MASGDAYNQRFDAIISNFNDKDKCVDDTCMWSNSIKAAFFQSCEWLDLCARNGITLNPKKFQFAQDTVNFAGLTITQTNIRPSTKFLDAICNFPTPTDITGARAWFGFINIGAYAFAIALHPVYAPWMVCGPTNCYTTSSSQTITQCSTLSPPMSQRYACKGHGLCVLA
ncbi:unnamed protein product [Mytilus coruscus]|uniref:Reverse transcriptase domain-containing protein n=1 Tax=Mytilus coruscus TaxID=42192 RepID=A0A6J7ZXB3_MYTCO|nr:unnamed protein product [Mytilus coruscus]